MVRGTAATAPKKKTPSFSSLSAVRKARRSATSKRPSSIGRSSKAADSASEPYEIGLRKRLENPVHACGYLTVCLDNADPALFLIALRHVIDAHGGMGKIAKAAGLNRESLYKALSLKGNPALQTIRAVLGALGIKIAFGNG